MNILIDKYVSQPHKRIILLSALALLIIFVGGLIYYQLFGPYDKSNKEMSDINIKAGMSTCEIAELLNEKQIIENSKVFQFYIKMTNRDGKLKAGYYALSSNMSMHEIAEMLEAGRVVTFKLTIPEGFTVKQIANLLIKNNIVDEDEFWRIVKEEKFNNLDFLKNIPQDEKRLEGYLFPDTYIIAKGMTEKQIVEMMLKRFNEVYNELPPNNTGLNERDFVILASLVELESLVDKDRPLIASVFLNRLKIGMKLDCDATLQYIFPERKKRVLYKDLEIESPYNTYKNRGLPPTPIGSPGKASLEAVLNPTDSNYLYFVAKKDGSGEHVFASSYNQHLNNKRELGY